MNDAPKNLNSKWCTHSAETQWKQGAQNNRWRRVSWSSLIVFHRQQFSLINQLFKLHWDSWTSVSVIDVPHLLLFKVTNGSLPLRCCSSLHPVMAPLRAIMASETGSWLLILSFLCYLRKLEWHFRACTEIYYLSLISAEKKSICNRLDNGDKKRQQQKRLELFKWNEIVFSKCLVHSVGYADVDWLLVSTVIQRGRWSKLFFRSLVCPQRTHLRQQLALLNGRCCKCKYPITGQILQLRSQITTYF